MTVFTEEKREWVAEQMMAKAHIDRCYVFDLFGNGTVVASRAPEGSSLRSETVQDYFEPTAWQEVRAHLLSYSPLPLVVDCRLGTGVVFPGFAAASSLGVLCLPSMPRDCLIRLAKSGLCGEFAMASSTADIRRRMSKRTEALLANFEAWMTEMETVFRVPSFSMTRDPREPINGALHDRMYSLAYYVGVPVSVRDLGEITSVGDFDFSLCSAFFLMSFCLARRVAIDRSVTVRLQMTGFGGACGIEISVPETFCAEEQQELGSMRAIAERKNILFDYVEGGGRLCIRFSPVCKDWSYLELKSPDLFDSLLP